VGIVGASGYGSRELFRILSRHRDVEIVAATSREEHLPLVSDLHPALRRTVDLRCEVFDAADLANRIDCAFLGLPHGAASEAAVPLLARGVRVIDLSADYRLRDPNTYAQWYHCSHADLENLKHAVYGLPELFPHEIPNARLIANPGCYPSSAILGLAPLLAGGLIDPNDIQIDSKSGISGAGRSPKPHLHFPECNESVTAYSVGNHRHTPEIEQSLTMVAGTPVSVIFTPHLMPMDRGILSSIYAKPVRSLNQDKLLELYREYYFDRPFVRIVEGLPATKDVVNTNYCDITVRCVKNRVLIFSCLDNLIKGAAGVAVQNFNLMFGFSETAGLV
jgi:N-acetyl-gamma-glutamyl-phosphate reductase